MGAEAFPRVFLDRMADVRGDGQVVYRFWQPGGGYDRNLRSVRDVREKIQYIHENPVRRSLVDKAEDGAWSSAREWTTGQVGTVPMDMASVPILVV